MQKTSISNNRILRLPEVKERTGLSRSTIYAMVKEGKFPAFIKISERATGWTEAAIENWIHERIEAAQPNASLEA